MLISHLYKFIFIKTIKTGGTSTEIYLEQYCVPDIEESHLRQSVISKEGIIGSRGQNDEYFNHMNAKQIKAKVGDGLFNTYTKIANIRNPFDLLVSHYHFKMTYDLYAKGRHLTFSEYINETQAVENLSENSKKMLFINNELVINAFIRQEYLENDLINLCNKLNLPESNRRLSHYKQSSERKDIHYSSFYDDSSRKIVEDEFSFYLDRFDYKFENEH